MRASDSRPGRHLRQVASSAGAGCTRVRKSWNTSCSAVSRSDGLCSPPKPRQKLPSIVLSSTRLPISISSSTCGAPPSLPVQHRVRVRVFCALAHQHLLQHLRRAALLAG